MERRARARKPSAEIDSPPCRGYLPVAMKIFRHVAGLPEAVHGSSVVVGNFDGVHVGHRTVIERARAMAAERGAPLSVLTFEPHPRRFFRPGEPPFQLTPLRGKVRLLDGIGVDNLLVAHFDDEMSRVSHRDFVRRFLVEGFRAGQVIVGHDFVFGAGRGGDVGYLRARAREDGFDLRVVEAVTAADGTVFSSTSIRTLLAEGRPRAAAELLGRPWEIEGRVLHGDRRGRGIGFPTANVSLEGYVRPALDVYAVFAGVEEAGRVVWHHGCATIGRRPTFGKEDVNVEVYILDFADDIYDRLLRVALVEHIRPERKFDGVAELREQIARDSRDARRLLEGLPDGDLMSPA